MFSNPIVVGLTLSLLAGLATTIGALIGLLVKKNDFKVLALGLGLSAGVMIYVSFAELLMNAIGHIGFLPANLAFFGGLLLIYLVDILVPHEYIAECLPTSGDTKTKKLARTGVMTAIGIAIHNVAEGMAVLVGTVHSLGVGLVLAVAIAIHNIPEGISVSLPIFCATGSRKKAFWFSFCSGLTEPLGALMAIIFLWPFMTPFFVNILLAFVGGIMVYISFDEILPAAHRYGEEHVVALGIILGMIVMAGTLTVLR
ncbi:MAG: zinc transporter ZupT [Candidatus Margulisbacteria bacterium]|nr:zinc transporter ZupT [Candidatus Margulisiibacteriota bacterium]